MLFRSWGIRSLSLVGKTIVSPSVVYESYEIESHILTLHSWSFCAFMLAWDTCICQSFRLCFNVAKYAQKFLELQIVASQNVLPASMLRSDASLGAAINHLAPSRIALWSCLVSFHKVPFSLGLPLLTILSALSKASLAIQRKTDNLVIPRQCCLY